MSKYNSIVETILSYMPKEAYDELHEAAEKAADEILEKCKEEGILKEFFEEDPNRSRELLIDQFITDQIMSSLEKMEKEHRES